MIRKRYIYVVLAIFCLLILLLCFYKRNPPELKLIDNILDEDKLTRKIPVELYNNYKKNALFNISLDYLVKPPSCLESNKTNKELFAIVMVTSYFANVETRSAMRRAFSSSELLNEFNIRRVFLLGQSPPQNNQVKQEAIVDEHRRFGDLVQGTFIEAYRNLTYKHLMGFKWINENCYNAKYLIKMDDDIVIDLKGIVKYLNESKLPTKNLLAGYVFRKMQPKRDPINKWYVTYDEYQHNYYPTFLSGWFYLTTPRIAAKLLLISNYHKYFWIDDVFITGILAQQLNIKHFNLSQYFTVFPEFLQCCINDFHKFIGCEIMIGPNGGDNNLFYKFNQAANNCFIRNCKKRLTNLNDTCVGERQTHLKFGNATIVNYKL